MAGKITRINWRSWSLNQIVMDPSLTLEEKEAKTGIPASKIKSQMYRINKAGGIKNFMAGYKNLSYQKPVIKSEKSIVQEIDPVLPLDNYDAELQFLNDSGLFIQIRSLLISCLPVFIKDKFILGVCKELRRRKYLQSIDFFVDTTSKIKDVCEYVFKNEIANLFKKDNSAYGGNLTEVSVPENSLSELAGHYLVGKESGVYYVDDYALNIINGENLKQLGSIDSVENYLGKYESQTINDTSKVEVVEQPKPIVEKKEIVPFIPFSPPRLKINENLWDEKAIPKITYDKIRSLYKKNREYFNSLIALREESKDNPFKTSVSGLQFYEYCDDPNRKGERVYLIRQGKGDIVWLFMKRTDFKAILQKYLSKYKLYPDMDKYISKLKMHHIVSDNIHHPEMDSIVINYSCLKTSVTIKNGILNTIIRLEMIY